MSDEFNETPWTEEQWEKFIRQGDVRSARYEELFETLADHPDCEELIAREMGWDSDEEEAELEFPEFALPSDDDEFDAEFDAEADPEVETEIRKRRSELAALPAYSSGYAWGLAVHKLLASLGDLDEDLEEIVARALEGSMSVAAKVAAGHSMGYEDESIGGNIVCCKRAAAFAEQALEALDELSQCECFPPQSLQPLIERGKQVRSLVEERIGELRSRVWWE